MSKKVVLGNAFSIQMIKGDALVSFKEVTREDIKEVLGEGFTSAIGHVDTANVLSNMLGVEVVCNRVNVELDSDTVLYVAQLTGGRLPEGSTTLPDGFRFKFYKVERK